MTNPARLFAAGLVAFTAAGSASAQSGCSVASQFSAASTYRNVVPTFGSNFSTFAGDVNTAMNMWNHSCGAMSGSNYPSFTTDTNAYRALVVPINYLPFDHAPTVSPQCGGYCRGSFDENSGVLTIYGLAGAPNHLQSWSSLRGNVRADLLAHEFGHSLGLADDSCPNGIMNIPIQGTEGITPDECTTADQMNHVPAEGTPNQGCDSPQDCHVSPIVLNLGEGEYALTDVAGGVWFDLDGDDTLEKVSWTRAGAEEAFLFLDRNGDGVVNNGYELFGSLSAANGFEALKAFDRPDQGDYNFGGNGNGWIDPGDAVWPRLRLWIDYNHDGQTQPNEVFTLDQKGILAIGLSYFPTGKQDGNGNRFRYAAPLLLKRKDGGMDVRLVYDIYFVVHD